MPKKLTVFIPDPAMVPLLETLTAFGIIQGSTVYGDGSVEVTLPRPYQTRVRLWEAYARQHGLSLNGRPTARARTPVPPTPPQGPSLVSVLDGNITQVQTALNEQHPSLEEVQELISAESRGKNRVMLLRWLQGVANELANQI